MIAPATLDPHRAETAMASILVVEDEENLRLSIRRSLTRPGHAVADAATLHQAREHLRATDFDLVITDINLAGDNGIDLVRELREDGFEGAILVITAFGTVESAVEAMKLGADEYLQKPLSLEELALVVDRALTRRKSERRLRLYERLEQDKAAATTQTLGDSDAWKNTLELVDRLAGVLHANAGQGELPAVLLQGETGAGKGVLARRLHALASRGAGGSPFVHVNCSALPATLIESELFGHEKGAFTDARAARAGLFEMADGGVIFLDEIGDMPIELQSRLLLVVERGVYRRVGGTRDRTVRACVIAATNQDLEARARTNEFRRDLYYRLSAFTVPIPPLRDRGRDAEIIANDQLARAAARLARPAATFSPETIAAIARHSWPGNVRELINAVQRAVMLCDDGVIEPEHLGLYPGAFNPDSPASPGSGGGGGATPNPDTIRFDFQDGMHTADDVERALIIQALAHCAGNVSRAAKLIGMSRGSLRYRIERAGLESHVNGQPKP
jgi:DNA-binding NtrC family response regulator